jgi:hypothetical protein
MFVPRLFAWVCLRVQWSREHVVPKSVLKNPRIANDPINIIALPRRLNNARSNYKYIAADINHPQGGTPIFPCSDCRNVSCAWVGYLTYKNGLPRFVPPDDFKRPIAQAALGMAERYPQYKTTIHTRVLDLDLATEWRNDPDKPPTTVGTGL